MKLIQLLTEKRGKKSKKSKKSYNPFASSNSVKKESNWYKTKSKKSLKEYLTEDCE